MQYSQYEDISNAIIEKYSWRAKIELILRLYYLLGIVAVVIAGCYLLLTLLPLKLSSNQQLSFIVGMVGVIFASLSKLSMVIIYQIRKRNDERLIKYSQILEFLTTWGLFESISKEIYKNFQNLDKNVDVNSLRSIISFLKKENLINNFDERVLTEALIIRNTIVHEGYILPLYSIQEITKTLSKIINKISETRTIQ